MKFVRSDIADEYGIALLQDKILEVMVYIDKFCNENDIDYCLMAGSALGARRHSGFIPWDDDIDIYMTAQDYDKFRNKFKSHGDTENYYLQEWGAVDKNGHHFITMAKVRMNGTLIEEKTFMNWNIHKGIFVDIFILHSSPDDHALQKKQYIWAEAVVLKGLTVRGYVPKNFKDRLMLAIGRMLPCNWIKYHGLYNNYKYKDVDTNYVSGFVDTRDFSRAVFPRNAIFPTKYVKFEDVMLKVPNDNDLYLKIQFGDDYLSLPHVEKRQVSKHAVSWETDYSGVFKDCSDESKLI